MSKPDPVKQKGPFAVNLPAGSGLMFMVVVSNAVVAVTQVPPVIVILTLTK